MMLMSFQMVKTLVGIVLTPTTTTPSLFTTRLDAQRRVRDYFSSHTRF